MDRVPGCPFCDDQDSVTANAQAYARFDKYPVAPGHLLLITRRHVPEFFAASREERLAMLELLEEAKKYLDQRFAPHGYNFGVNVGEAAGQTIMHVHLHLIPRYRGDTPNPRGGVRGVIPEKQSY
jgi:diadenosine tetraphosphate (Ap4A) HIT family hydrolase